MDVEPLREVTREFLIEQHYLSDDALVARECQEYIEALRAEIALVAQERRKRVMNLLRTRTPAEVARMIGVTRKRVTQIRDRALGR